MNTLRITYKVAPESELTPETRQSASGIFPPAWVNKSAAIRERGWVQVRPFIRALAYDAESSLVGQASLVDVTAKQEELTGINRAMESDPVSCFGISEVVVREDLRGQKIGGELMRLIVEAAQEQEKSAIIMAASNVPPVVHTLGRLGFRNSAPFEVFYRDSLRPEHCIWNQDWLVRGELPPTPYQISSDF